MSEFSEDFVKRGFKINIIDSQFRRAKERSRDSLLSQEKKGAVNNGVAFVLNYHSALSKINGIIDSLWPVVHASDAMKKHFVARQLISYRKPRDLKDELVRSRVKKAEKIYTYG